MITPFKSKRFKNLSIIDHPKIYSRYLILGGYLIAQVQMKDLSLLLSNGTAQFKIRSTIQIKWTMRTHLILSLSVNLSKKSFNKAFQ